jgi:hypothetical protein
VLSGSAMRMSVNFQVATMSNKMIYIKMNWSVAVIIAVVVVCFVVCVVV